MHPDLVNPGPLAVQPLLLADEQGTPLLVVVFKGSFRILADRPAQLLEEQPAPNLEGTSHGDPAHSSVRLEPEVAFFKPATDVVLLGQACAPEGPVRQLDVGISLGPVQKVVKVFGERLWVPTNSGVFTEGPQPFERIPLLYERAFGGHDPQVATAFEMRNPVGRGYLRPGGMLHAPMLLPNIEDPQRLLQRPGDTPPPAGFGFVAPHWQPRAALVGTYDEAWETTRKPALPQDFQRAFLNAASPGLVAPGYLRGDEPVVVLNASRQPRLAFSLPGLPTPTVRVAWRAGGRVELQPLLDTVIVDTDTMLLQLLWRCHLALPPRGIHAVAAIVAGPVP